MALVRVVVEQLDQGWLTWNEPGGKRWVGVTNKASLTQMVADIQQQMLGSVPEPDSANGEIVAMSEDPEPTPAPEEPPTEPTEAKPDEAAAAEEPETPTETKPETEPEGEPVSA